MGLLDSFWNALRSDPELQGLADEQNQAVVDALVGTVFSDQHMAPEEIKEFNRQLEKLPWRWAHDEAERERVITVARNRADALTDPAGARQFVASLAERLTSATVREKVYRMCLAITFADKQVEPGEVSLLEGMRRAFGLPEPRAEEITADVRRELKVPL